MGSRPALHTIGSGFAHGLARGHVGLDLGGRHGRKAHPRLGHGRHALTPFLHRHGRQHPVRLARELLQHALGVLGGFGFAQNVAAQRHRGVRAQHRRRRQALGLEPGHRRVKLEGRDALHVTRRRFTPMHRFQRLGVIVRVGQQQLVLDTDLCQQLAAAGTLGSQVDECTHSRW